MIPNGFENAGKVVRDNVDAPATPTEHAVQRARLVDRVTGDSRGRRPWMAVAALVPAVVLLAVVLWLRPWVGSAAAVTFQIGPSGSAGVVGEYVNPPKNTEVLLQFSEGSKVVLLPQARARVAKTTSKGAAVVLETGTAQVEVVHRPGADWSVSAGPYTISVKGTSFDVTWDAAAGALLVTMHNGVVVVRGPNVEAGVEVRDTQRFSSRAVAAVDPGDAAPADSVSSASSAPVESPSNAASVAAVPMASAAPAEPWSKLAAKGDFRAILQDAQQRGLDTTLGSGSESDLASLAAAARHTGNVEIARRALMAIRSRYPGGSQAAPSAFLLGRMSEDAGSLGAAIRWYDVYLSEASGGSLAPEALGRKMVALRNSGQVELAHNAADQYVARFPSGPYAGVAREILKP